MSTERKLQFRPSPLQRADEAADAPKCKTSICQQISNLGLRGTMASTNDDSSTCLLCTRELSEVDERWELENI